ncbi:hypothetical protein KIW84_075708 [Lathyrus oleraceus]|uniref:Uncharacterized protein n=1 Tax=Pisum sativum TaxID=3888 RepID=A0A9D4VXI0_PEA|nr:hypothetical protein KIW84_075708 [Pisum sativum]
MLQRIRSYITFLETRLHKFSQNPRDITPYIFTDSDLAVVDDLGQIFRDHPNFHMALTFRNNEGQPLNSGLIAARCTRPVSIVPLVHNRSHQPTYSPTGVAITSSGTKKGELFLGDVNTQLKNKNITTDIKVDTNSNLFITITVNEPAPGALGVDDILGFDFIEKPSRTAIIKSLEQLSDLVGWQMARPPLGPIHSKATYKTDEVELRNARAADFLVVSSRKVVGK